MSHTLWQSKVEGILLGTAIGDTLGLAREGLAPQRAARLFGMGPLKHSFLFGRGMWSDDTEHTYLVARALLTNGDDPQKFARNLARSLRWWLIRLPAGVGMATARALIKSWLGFSPSRSGVWSAGNGPAMRSAILGLLYDRDQALCLEMVRASTRLTHTDPRAEQGALLISVATSLALQYRNGEFPRSDVIRQLLPLAQDAGLQVNLLLMERMLTTDSSPSEFVQALGLKRGVSGFVNHTVPVALFCWLKFPTDFTMAIESVIRLGGDADTSGAIVGALAGATVGSGNIPQAWQDGIAEWPLNVQWIKDLAKRLATRFPEQAQGPQQSAPSLYWPLLIPRNLLFLAVVLTHGFRRLAPPY
jgi:ADP-ribosyl-[dinitrogen reductase] hydrolase